MSDPEAAGSSEAEAKQGLDCIDAASEAGGIEFVVLASVITCDTCPDTVGFFKSKLKMEQRLKESGLKHVILRPGFFMENFNHPDRNPLTKGKVTSLFAPSTTFFCIATADVGKAAAAACANPEKWNGKIVDLVSFVYSAEDVASALSRASGVTCKVLLGYVLACS